MKTKSLLLLTSLSISLCLNAQTPDAMGTFTDSRDNKTYKTVKIGGQTWMAENLAYLPSVNPTAESSETVPYYYVYDYNGTNIQEAKATSNYKTYGVLYNWNTAKTICPAGWHLPSNIEWETLTTYICGDKNVGVNDEKYDYYYWTEIGEFLKSKTGWYNDCNGTDDYGFTAIPGGHHCAKEIGRVGSWWSFTEGSNSAYCWNMSYNSKNMSKYDIGKELGFSVRCLSN